MLPGGVQIQGGSAVSDNDATLNTPTDVPDLFPLPTANSWSFANVGNVSFGWTEKNGKHDAQFQVQKVGTFRGWTPVKTWPLTEPGWQAASEFMRSTHPDLFEQVREAARRDADRKAALARSAEFRELRQDQKSLATLAGCVLLGGYGVGDGISAGTKIDLHFTDQEIWLTKATGHIPYLRRSYAAARAFEFEGGVVRTGGGYMGGGFGVLGAAEGIAMATLLNSLTSKSSVHTTIRFETEDAEIFLFTDQATPKTLLMQFAEVRAKIKTAAASPPEDTPETKTGDLTEQLARLGDLFQKGLLTANEFAAAKTRLLN